MKEANLHIISILLIFLLTSCLSTKSTLKNVDNNAPNLVVTKDNKFVISEYSNDKNYGYDPDYPINLFYKNTNDEIINPTRFFNAISGPNGEILSYKKIESCCPFPSKNTVMGAGFLDVYEVTWEGNTKPVKLFINIYEKSTLKVPVGFTLRN